MAPEPSGIEPGRSNFLLGINGDGTSGSGEGDGGVETTIRIAISMLILHCIGLSGMTPNEPLPSNQGAQTGFGATEPWKDRQCTTFSTALSVFARIIFILREYASHLKPPRAIDSERNKGRPERRCLPTPPFPYAGTTHSRISKSAADVTIPHLAITE